MANMCDKWQSESRQFCRSPRFQLYHACEHITRKSRADSCTHCLHARWKKMGGRDSSTCADGTIKINPISLCSHTDAHPNLTREVRHSLTWHSSKSESARERFEPVAADKLRLDGSLAMFAPEGDGCLNRARREEAGRIHKAGTTLCDFWYFWSCKSTRKEKFL